MGSGGPSSLSPGEPAGFQNGSACPVTNRSCGGRGESDNEGGRWPLEGLPSRASLDPFSPRAGSSGWAMREQGNVVRCMWRGAVGEGLLRFALPASPLEGRRRKDPLSHRRTGGESASALGRAWPMLVGPQRICCLLSAALIPAVLEPVRALSSLLPAGGLSAAGQEGTGKGRGFTSVRDHGAICLRFLRPAGSVKSKTCPRILRCGS